MRSLPAPDSFHRSHFPFLSLACLSLLLAFLFAFPLLAAPKPNIIVILTDDQSPRNPPSAEAQGLTVPASFSFLGDKTLTPNADLLAREGIYFSRATVSCPVCSPSRYTTFTGRYASRSEGEVFNRLFPMGNPTRPENNIELGKSELALPNLLRQAGYTTAWVGKAHIFEQDILDHPAEWELKGLKTYGLDADPKTDTKVNEAMRANQAWWQAKIKSKGFDWVGAVYPGNLRDLCNEPANVHNVEWTTRSILDFLQTQDPDSGKPFFLYYGTTIPHGPDPWIKQEGRYVHSLDADPGYTGEGYRTDLDYSFMPSRKAILEQVRAGGYDEKHAYLTWFDHSLGAILEKLKERKLDQNTLILLTSDHGTWRYGKTTMYEGGLNVPLIMRWPAGIPAGRTYSHFVQNIDYAPTMLELAGASLPTDYKLDGISLVPVLTGSSNEALREETFHEIGYARAVKTEKWKYIAIRYPEAIQRKIAKGEKFRNFPPHPPLDLPYLVENTHLGYHSSKYNPHYFETDQLYDLENDPEEKVNLLGQHPEVVKDLKERLRRHLAAFPGRPFGEFYGGK